MSASVKGAGCAVFAWLVYFACDPCGDLDRIGISVGLSPGREFGGWPRSVGSTAPTAGHPPHPLRLAVSGHAR